jgi:hypothetical protein
MEGPSKAKKVAVKLIEVFEEPAAKPKAPASQPASAPASQPASAPASQPYVEGALPKAPATQPAGAEGVFAGKAAQGRISGLDEGQMAVVAKTLRSHIADLKDAKRIGDCQPRVALAVSEEGELKPAKKLGGRAQDPTAVNFFGTRYTALYRTRSSDDAIKVAQRLYGDLNLKMKQDLEGKADAEPDAAGDVTYAKGKKYEAPKPFFVLRQGQDFFVFSANDGGKILAAVEGMRDPRKDPAPPPKETDAEELKRLQAVLDRTGKHSSEIVYARGIDLL